MKTLTQAEIDLMVSVLETAVENVEFAAQADYIMSKGPWSVRYANNQKSIEDAKTALAMAKRLKPLEVLHKAHYHAEDDGEYMIYSALNGVCEDCIDVLIVKD